MQMIFEKIIIIDNRLKKAKIQNFSKGINVITSSDSGVGNYQGKSTLVRSLFYSLGADVYFDESKGWQKDYNYYYILYFNIDDTKYIIFRYGSFFSIFNENEKLLFKTNNREELYDFLSKIYQFDIYLKESGTKKYKKSQPFSFYSLSFIDQLHFSGCSFESFKNMGQFSDIYSDIIYAHLGVNNKDINDLTDMINSSTKRIENLLNSYNTIKSMISKIDCEKEFSSYADSFDVLVSNLEMHKKEYEVVIKKLNQSKKKLYDMYNMKSKLLLQINELSELLTSDENEKILKTHSCPLCNTSLDNYVNLYFKKVRADAELQYQLIDFNEELQALERKIMLEKSKYECEFNRLTELEKVIMGEDLDVKKTITSMGVKKYKESLIKEYEQLLSLIDKEKEELEKNIIKRKKIQSLAKQIDQIYFSVLEDILVKYDVTIFKLPEKVSISKKFNCSDNHILSTIWLTALNKVKVSLDNHPIIFPIVFDNPTDRDFDESNESAILNMIFDCRNEENQIIVTKVEFDIANYNNAKIDNVISLNNPRYNLLINEDYEAANKILKKLVISQTE